MPTPQNSRKNERPSTYFVHNREQREELVRLTIQDHMLTTGMGGPLSEQAAPSSFRQALDVGCGPGGWAIETALMYPHISLLGIDISQRMTSYASAQAAEQHVTARVSFRVMDALHPLDFPNASFDLVNMRLGSSYLRTWDWPIVLGEFLRVTRPGGVIRLTDSENGQQSTSAALTRFFDMFVNALFHAGHLFTQERTGLVAHLPRLLTRLGCKDVQTKTFALEFRAGTPEGQAYYNDLLHLQTLRPFIQKWGTLAGDFDAIYRQALSDAQQSDFLATWTFQTIWGTRP